MIKENLAKAEILVSSWPTKGVGFYNLMTKELAQALDEKDEAHQAEIARIREAIENCFEEPEDTERVLAAFNSAVNQEPT